MKQLLFHGKKTVPSAIRRDLWAPYFSVHFPKTPDGAAKGLEVFRHLRELSLRRQLDPPKYLKLVDEEYLTRWKENAGHNLHRLLQRSRTMRGWRHRAVDLPIPGQRMHQNALANRLMNQKASSVADLSAALTLLAPEGGGIKVKQVDKERLPPWIARKREAAKEAGQQELLEESRAEEPAFTQELTGREEGKEIALKSLSDRAFKRIQAIRREQEKKIRQIDARKLYLNEDAGQVRLDRHTLERLSTEYDGSIGTPGLFPTTLDMIEAKNKVGDAELAFEKALKDLHAEKDSKRVEIETAEAARIDQELASKTEDERQQIQAAIQAEKEQNTELINTEISKTRETLKEYKDQARAFRTKYNNDKHANIADDRRLVREVNEFLLERKAYLLQRHTKWCGPYAQITTRVDEAMAVIEEAHRERIAELEKDVQTELDDKLARNTEPVLVRWANPSDGQYGGKWPESVTHGSLENKAVVLRKGLVVRQHAHLDANEEPVDEQKTIISLPTSNSVHVFGAEADIDNRYQSPEQLKKMMQDARESRVAEHVQTSKIQARDKIVALQILQADLTSELEYLDIDLGNAIKNEIDSALHPLENNLRSMRHYEFDPEYAAWVADQLHEGIPRLEAELAPSLEEKLSKVSPDGATAEDSSSVMDSTVSAEAKKLAIRLADVRAELAVFKYRHQHTVAEDVGDYEKFASLFTERANLGQLYPAAEEWLAEDNSVFQKTESAPEGVSQLQAFESEHSFISAAMKRSRLQADSPFSTDAPRSLDVLNNKILRLNRRLAKAMSILAEKPIMPGKATLSPTAKWVNEIRSELNNLREERVKAIQHNNPAFDKQAWRAYREQEMGYVAEIVEAKNKEEAKARRPEPQTQAEPEPEPAKPTGLLDRVKGLFSRK